MFNDPTAVHFWATNNSLETNEVINYISVKIHKNYNISINIFLFTHRYKTTYKM